MSNHDSPATSGRKQPSRPSRPNAKMERFIVRIEPRAEPRSHGFVDCTLFQMVTSAGVADAAGPDVATIPDSIPPRLRAAVHAAGIPDDFAVVPAAQRVPRSVMHGIDELIDVFERVTTRP